MRPSPTPQVALGRAIALRRSETGLTQEALADAEDMAVRTLRSIEAGRGNPRADVLDRIARGLGWPMWELAKLADELETEDRRPTDRPLAALQAAGERGGIVPLVIPSEAVSDRTLPAGRRRVAH